MADKMRSEMIDDQIKELSKLKNHSVEAGWFETNVYVKGERVPDRMVGVPVARIARIQEFGAVIRRGNSIITIPARPFMRLAWHRIQEGRKGVQDRVFKRLLDGKINPNQAMQQIGLYMEGCIVDSIKGGGWQKNADSTIAKKGFDTPLIDSGTMFKTVSSKVSSST